MSVTTSSWMDAKRMEAVEKVVLQRAKISRITRQLKNRLALASYKTKRGWENLDLDSIEPKIAEEVARRRSSSHSGDSLGPFSSPIKESSSSANGLLPPPFPNGHFNSSSKKQQSGSSRPLSSSTSLSARKRARTLSHDTRLRASDISSSYSTWEPANQHNDEDRHLSNTLHDRSHSVYSPINMRLSQSSPVYPGVSHQTYPSVYSQGLAPSFSPPLQRLPNGSPSKQRQTKTGPKSQLKQHRKNRSSVASAKSAVSTTSTISISEVNHSSPPRTPPRRIEPFSSGISKTGEEGADLLMFLATSPSPAQRSSFNSTPIHHQTSISSYPPSSIIAQTPPMHERTSSNFSFGTPLLAPQTPSQGFNFSDYVNIFTPSPAQGQWQNRTPIITPSRRRLNFDQLPGHETNGDFTIQATSISASGGSKTSFGSLDVDLSLGP
ncbi:hypothetical protein V1514DRAFT_238398 [Lipomyces japonicus]|uniref:uncharacterized protein n=1 Tax=Lipomyces japonicus TaxID=56871 RepID=UPI0034CE4A76